MSSSQKNLSTPTIKRYLSAPAQLGARDRSIWLSLSAGDQPRMKPSRIYCA